MMLGTYEVTNFAFETPRDTRFIKILTLTYFHNSSISQTTGAVAEFIKVPFSSYQGSN